MREYIISADDVKVLEEEFGIILSFDKRDELIRCKDCKHRITANCERFGIKRYTQSDSFCSWAEPKESHE